MSRRVRAVRGQVLAGLVLLGAGCANESAVVQVDRGDDALARRPTAGAATGGLGLGRFARFTPLRSLQLAATAGPTVATRGAHITDLTTVAAVAPPVALRIEARGIAAPVVPVGVDLATGELAVPSDPAQIGWYHFGSAPGTPGSAVLAGHVDWKGRPGAFLDLDRVQVADRIDVERADGTTVSFTVTTTELVGKTELPDALFERSGTPRLVLITCGGEFDSSIRRYRHNVVVIAVPA